MAILTGWKEIGAYTRRGESSARRLACEGLPFDLLNGRPVTTTDLVDDWIRDRVRAKTALKRTKRRVAPSGVQ